MKIKCTCGTVSMEGAIVELAMSGTYHRLEGPCYTETEPVAPDWGPLVGCAAGRFLYGPEAKEQERKLREAVLGAQQPEPTPTDEPSAHDLVIADMAARKEFGLAKYGSLLQPGNGRDNLQDLYEELLDACVYIRNEIERRNNDVGPLGDKIGRLLEIAEHGHAVYVGEAGPDPEDAAFLRNFRREFGGTAEFEPEP